MVQYIGRRALASLNDVLYGAGFFLQIIRETLLFFRRRQTGFRVFVLQVLFTGIEALGVISLLSLVLGLVIIIQGLSLLPQFGQQQLLYRILIIVITRELGPILTAFVIIARSSTAIATELGNMVVTHEIEAYVSIGVNPVSYLVVPRFLGVIVASVFLNIYFNIAGLAGSFLVAQFVRPVPFADYFQNLFAVLRPEDILSGLIKSIVFGVIISTVATYYGFKVNRASWEIPQMAISSVGKGFMLCILANALITLIYYL